MFDKGSARKLLAAIEHNRLHASLLSDTDISGDHVRQMALVHTKLDEARLWLQDAIGYDRP